MLSDMVRRVVVTRRNMAIGLVKEDRDNGLRRRGA
jgi:hypothetical protein